MYGLAQTIEHCVCAHSGDRTHPFSQFLHCKRLAIARACCALRRVVWDVGGRHPNVLGRYSSGHSSCWSSVPSLTSSIWAEIRDSAFGAVSGMSVVAFVGRACRIASLLTAPQLDVGSTVVVMVAVGALALTAISTVVVMGRLWTTQHKKRQDNTRQVKTKQQNTIQHNTSQDNTTQHEPRHNKTSQDKTTQQKTSQLKTRQRKTMQDKTTQDNTTQHNTTHHYITTQHNTK